MNFQEMTVNEYRNLRKVSAVAVTRAMNRGDDLIGVKHYEKVRRDWILLVDVDAAKKNPKKCLVIPK